MAANAPYDGSGDPYDVPDLTQLEYLNETSLLQALQTRYQHGKIYVGLIILFYYFISEWYPFHNHNNNNNNNDDDNNDDDDDDSNVNLIKCPY